jgi:hypothetical protein
MPEIKGPGRKRGTIDSNQADQSLIIQEQLYRTLTKTRSKTILELANETINPHTNQPISLSTASVNLYKMKVDGRAIQMPDGWLRPTGVTFWDRRAELAIMRDRFRE